MCVYIRVYILYNLPKKIDKREARNIRQIIRPINKPGHARRYYNIIAVAARDVRNTIGCTT